MKLTISERFQFLTLFPEQGSLLVQLTIRDIVDKVNLNDKERKAINFKIVDTTATWDIKKAKEIDVEFTNAELQFLKKRIQTLDEEGKISQQNLSLCLKLQKAE